MPAHVTRPGIPEADLERLAMIGARLLAGRPHRVGGSRPRNRPGSGHEFLDYRAWQSGDDVRHIDWRASARSDRLEVRHYLDEAGSEWMLCLDASASMAAADPAKWQLALQLSIALVWTLTAVGDRVGLIVFADQIINTVAPGAGQAQRLRLVTALHNGTVPGGGSVLRCCGTRLDRKPKLIVLSDFLRPDAMCTDLDELVLRSRGCHVLQILSAQETALPDGPETVLIDAEDAARLSLTIDDATRVRARQRLRQVQTHLAEHCRARNIGHDCCDTSEDWREIGTRQLQRLARA